MGLLGKLFGKSGRKAAAEVKKFTNKDLMEACIGGSLLVAYANGVCDESELKSLERQIAANPAFEGYGTEINKTMTRFISQLDAGFRVGKMHIMREIGDCTNDPMEAEEIMVTCITIAEADGNIDSDEINILRDIANKLGVNLRDFGLEDVA